MKCLVAVLSIIAAFILVPLTNNIGWWAGCLFIGGILIDLVHD